MPETNINKNEYTLKTSLLIGYSNSLMHLLMLTKPYLTQIYCMVLPKIVRNLFQHRMTQNTIHQLRFGRIDISGQVK